MAHGHMLCIHAIDSLLEDFLEDLSDLSEYHQLTWCLYLFTAYVIYLVQFSMSIYHFSFTWSL